jgi:transcriptional regulator with XRE-family HTH domain
MTFGELIRLRRQEKDLNQDELAKLLGVSQSFVSQLERGGRENPNLETMTAFALILDLNGLDFAPVIDAAKVKRQELKQVDV